MRRACDWVVKQINISLIRGDIPEEMAAAYEKLRKNFDTLQRTASSLAEALERIMPNLDFNVTHLVSHDSGIVNLSARVCFSA